MLDESDNEAEGHESTTPARKKCSRLDGTTAGTNTQTEAAVIAGPLAGNGNTDMITCGLPPPSQVQEPLQQSGGEDENTGTGFPPSKKHRLDERTPLSANIANQLESSVNMP
jgi:hypothetical protein